MPGTYTTRCARASSKATSSPDSLLCRSIAQVTSPDIAMTSSINSNNAGSSLATRRDSPRAPPPSTTTAWWCRLPTSTPAQTFSKPFLLARPWSQDELAGRSLSSDDAQLSISGRVVRRAGGQS